MTGLRQVSEVYVCKKRKEVLNMSEISHLKDTSLRFFTLNASTKVEKGADSESVELLN